MVHPNLERSILHVMVCFTAFIIITALSDHESYGTANSILLYVYYMLIPYDRVIVYFSFGTYYLFFVKIATFYIFHILYKLWKKHTCCAINKQKFKGTKSFIFCRRCLHNRVERVSHNRIPFLTHSLYLRFIRT